MPPHFIELSWLELADNYFRNGESMMWSVKSWQCWILRKLLTRPNAVCLANTLNILPHQLTFFQSKVSKNFSIFKFVSFSYSTNLTHLSIMLANRKVRRRTEVMMYPWVSFVSEFGGALGLFVGFSFMMFWDFAEYSFVLFLNKAKR